MPQEPHHRWVFRPPFWWTLGIVLLGQAIFQLYRHATNPLYHLDRYVNYPVYNFIRLFASAGLAFGILVAMFWVLEKMLLNKGGKGLLCWSGHRGPTWLISIDLGNLIALYRGRPWNGGTGHMGARLGGLSNWHAHRCHPWRRGGSLFEQEGSVSGTTRQPVKIPCSSPLQRRPQPPSASLGVRGLQVRGCLAGRSLLQALPPQDR